jgi:hypothetical protein
MSPEDHHPGRKDPDTLILTFRIVSEPNTVLPSLIIDTSRSYVRHAGKPMYL